MTAAHCTEGIDASEMQVGVRGLHPHPPPTCRHDDMIGTALLACCQRWAYTATSTAGRRRMSTLAPKRLRKPSALNPPQPAAHT